MATNVTTINQRGRYQRQRGDRRQLVRAAAAAVPQEYFAPERQWLQQRGPTLNKAYNMAKMAVSLVNAEKQFYDVSGNLNPVLVPTPQYLCGIPQGDDDQTRNGNTIRAKELDVRMHFYAGSAATSNITVRVFIVIDNDPRGVVPNVGTLFQGGTASVDGMPVLDLAQGRFKWIFDETFTLEGSAAAGGKVVIVQQKLDRHINYTGTTGATASCGAGAIFLYCLTDIATPSPTGTFYSRLRYYDN